MGSKKQTTTSTRDPYAPAQPLFRQSAGMIQSYLNNPNSTAVYGGPRTVGMSDATRGGLDALANNRGYEQSRDYLSRTINGEYLNKGNPYIDELMGSVRSAVMPGVNQTFARSGMMGSTMHQGALTRALTDGMAQPLFQNYQNERAAQDRAAMALPGMDQGNAMNRIQAGQMGEGYDRERMAADWQKWEEQRTAPMRALRETMPFTHAIGGAGGTSTETTTQRGNPWEQALGVGMMGANLMSGGALSGLGGMMGGMSQYGMFPWLNAGGSNFGFRGGFATPGQRA